MSEEVKVKYDEIKKKKTHRYLIFFIKDEKTIAIEKIGTGVCLINNLIQTNFVSLLHFSFKYSGLNNLT